MITHATRVPAHVAHLPIAPLLYPSHLSFTRRTSRLPAPPSRLHADYDDDGDDDDNDDDDDDVNNDIIDG